MNEKRFLLKHFLASLAYRTQKALRGMPSGFENFRAGEQVRTPHELICHMTSVLGYARTFFIGGNFAHPVPLDWKKDLTSFHNILEDLGKYMDSSEPLRKGITEEQLLQGPFSDAMTHAGQIAMLRRLYGSPVAPENFIKASIDTKNLSENQAEPVAPDQDWPEKPI